MASLKHERGNGWVDPSYAPPGGNEFKSRDEAKRRLVLRCLVKGEEIWRGLNRFPAKF